RLADRHGAHGAARDRQAPRCRSGRLVHPAARPGDQHGGTTALSAGTGRTRALVLQGRRDGPRLAEPDAVVARYVGTVRQDEPGPRLRRRGLGVLSASRQALTPRRPRLFTPGTRRSWFDTAGTSAQTLRLGGEMDERVTRVREILGLRRLPIKIGFLDKLPALPRWVGGPVAAGCVFWDAAMDGKSFYTIAADHWNCAVGSHVHRIRPPSDRTGELDATV